jgi:hypothetical protein
MSKKYILFKRIEVDLATERKRIHAAHYNKRQRAALLKLIDLFEQGKFQECLNHVRNPKAFPYSKSGEYPEQEHIGIEISHVLVDMGRFNYYTREQLLREAATIKNGKKS